MRIKTLAFAGDLYPATCAQMRLLLGKFETFLKENILEPSLLEKRAQVIIVPYGSYEEMGWVSFFAHRLLGANPLIERLLLLSPWEGEEEGWGWRCEVDSYALLSRELPALKHSGLPEALRTLPLLPLETPTPKSEVHLPLLSYHFKGKTPSLLELFYAPSRLLEWSTLLGEISLDPHTGIILVANLESNSLAPLSPWLASLGEPLLFPHQGNYSLAYPLQAQRNLS